LNVNDVRKVLKAPKSLHMNGVPAIARQQFLDLAESKFSANYGLTLAYLMELYSVWFPRLFNYEVRLNRLEQTISAKQDDSSVKSISGRPIK